MEIYNLYQGISTSVEMFKKDGRWLHVGSLLGAFGVWLLLFLLQGFGLYAMAKKRGIKRRGLAFVPFANILLMGKIAGDCNFFGQKVKRAGLYTMIAQVITTALLAFILALEIALYATQGVPNINWINEYSYEKQWDVTGVFVPLMKASNVFSLIVPIFELIYEIFLLILMLGVYKRYAPKRGSFLAFFGLFIPYVRFIAIFALRNREPFDYEAYMRARHEEYMRRYHQQYSNPYGNPYGQNPYGNPYGQNPYGEQSSPQQPSPPEEPFAEFDTRKNGAQSGEGQSEGQGVAQGETRNESTNDGTDGFF